MKENSQGDQLLRILTMLASVGEGVPVTLTLGGLLVTGKIVTEKHYVDNAVGPMIAHIADEGFRDEVSKVFNSYYDQFEGEGGPKVRDSDLIHLEGARFFASGAELGPKQGEGVLWRGRITEVSGFSLGTLDVS